MAKLILLLFIVAGVLALLALSRKGTPERTERSSRDLAPLLNQLERVGYLRYVKPEQVENVKGQMLRDGDLFPEGLKRVHLADAESLAEQGVLEFIADIHPFLMEQGVHLPFRQEKGKKRKTRNQETGEVIEFEPIRWVPDNSLQDTAEMSYIKPIQEDCPESGKYYSVTIGEFTQEIWNSDMREEEYWEGGMCHTFLLVNALLEKAGSAERVYGVSGGNEGWAVFLTEEQYEVIRDSPLLDDTDKPWVPYLVGKK